MIQRNVKSEQQRRKLLYWTVFSALIASCIAGFLALHAYSRIEDEDRIAVAPRVTNKQLAATYDQSRELFRQRYDNKWLVVTGEVVDINAGWGDGCIHIGSVRCDVNGHYGSANIRKPVTIFGRCIASRALALEDCRVLAVADR